MVFFFLNQHTENFPRREFKSQNVLTLSREILGQESSVLIYLKSATFLKYTYIKKLSKY